MQSALVLVALLALCAAGQSGGSPAGGIATPAADGVPDGVSGEDGSGVSQVGEPEHLAPHHQLHKQPAESSSGYHLPLPQVDNLPVHHLTKRHYPRWYQAFTYKTPTYDSWRTSQLAESKRFLPFHPLARFRGLSMGSSSSGRGNTVGRNTAGRTSGSVPAMTEDDARWVGGSRGSITPFSDLLAGDMQGHPMNADHSYVSDEAFEDEDDQASLVSSDDVSQQADEDVAIEEAFRHRLGSVLGKESGARSRGFVRQDGGHSGGGGGGDSVLKAGDLLKYLMAVNGNRNVGSSLRFGFTK